MVAGSSERSSTAIADCVYSFGFPAIAFAGTS